MNRSSGKSTLQRNTVTCAMSLYEGWAIERGIVIGKPYLLHDKVVYVERGLIRGGLMYY